MFLASFKVGMITTLLMMNLPNFFKRFTCWLSRWIAARHPSGSSRRRNGTYEWQPTRELCQSTPENMWLNRRIPHKYGTTVNAIAAIADPSAIFEGQQLVIPAGTTQESDGQGKSPTFPLSPTPLPHSTAPNISTEAPSETPAEA